ncbi:hypothetical protein [Treponema sp. J25]|uniref:hypothetical protein n=1 Tax=Treponema sp. J25 TaxID=2094121 RepID=UPI00104761DE|nr:hypothetical protein [Treponema sp. J25]NMC56069.1 hypothetical protein [Eubacteriaceae bacterium]TCW61928.1 hypothetical protein C5O22_04170 [Treponema sp. J25]
MNGFTEVSSLELEQIEGGVNIGGVIVGGIAVVAGGALVISAITCPSPVSIPAIKVGIGAMSVGALIIYASTRG